MNVLLYFRFFFSRVALLPLFSLGLFPSIPHHIFFFPLYLRNPPLLLRFCSFASGFFLIRSLLLLLLERQKLLPSKLCCPSVSLSLSSTSFSPSFFSQSYILPPLVYTSFAFKPARSAETPSGQTGRKFIRSAIQPHSDPARPAAQPPPGRPDQTLAKNLFPRSLTFRELKSWRAT